MGASLPGEGSARILPAAGTSAMDWKTYYRDELADPVWEARLTEWLEQGPDRRVADALAEGGIVSMPHTAAGYSGRMIAGLVSSLYASGTRRVLALGVLHTSMVPQSAVARDSRRPLGERREAADALSGVILPAETTIDTPYGPLPAWRPAEDPDVVRIDRHGVLSGEFSLDTLAAILSLGARTAGRAPLPLLRAYVGLTRDPIDETFLMADRVADWVRHAWTPGTAVVTTGDLVHFGTAYGMAEDDPRKECHFAVLASLFRDEVWAMLTSGIIRSDEYAYRRGSDDLNSDQREILPILPRLLGEHAGCEILEFSLSDYAGILEAPPPCLVASAAVAYLPR